MEGIMKVFIRSIGHLYDGYIPSLLVYKFQKLHMKFSTHVSLMLTHIRNWSFLGAYLRIISLLQKKNGER